MSKSVPHSLYGMLSRSVGRVERFVFGGISHEMYPQRGQRISSSTRFLTAPVFSGFCRVWHCGHRTARNSSASLLPKYAPILNRTNNNATMKRHTQLKIRKGIFKLAPSVKSNWYYWLTHQQYKGFNRHFTISGFCNGIPKERCEKRIGCVQKCWEMESHIISRCIVTFSDDLP